MKLKSLEDLQKLPDSDMIDLSQTSFNDYGPFTFNTYIVPREFEMRMDLVCDDIYDSVEFVDFLLWINRITNPFNIKQGMELIFVPPDIITRFYAKKDNQGKVQDVFLNKGKVKRKDKNRSKFKQQKRGSLPPTVNESPNQQVRVEGDSIIIGGGIFDT